MNSNKINLVNDILDALEHAKEANALMPQLPPNMKPVYLHILTAIYRIRDDTGSSRVTDINKELNYSLPNTIKFINELVTLNVLKKIPCVNDKRVVLVQATEIGEQYIQKYVFTFHNCLEEEISMISEADCLTMIKTIDKIYQAIEKVIKKMETERSDYN